MQRRKAEDCQSPFAYSLQLPLSIASSDFPRSVACRLRLAFGEQKTPCNTLLYQEKLFVLRSACKLLSQTAIRSEPGVALQQ
jgi:hypothetical protein